MPVCGRGGKTLQCRPRAARQRELLEGVPNGEPANQRWSTRASPFQRYAANRCGWRAIGWGGGVGPGRHGIHSGTTVEQHRAPTRRRELATDAGALVGDTSDEAGPPTTRKIEEGLLAPSSVVPEPMTTGALLASDGRAVASSQRSSLSAFLSPSRPSLPSLHRSFFAPFSPLGSFRPDFLGFAVLLLLPFSDIIVHPTRNRSAHSDHDTMTGPRVWFSSLYSSFLGLVSKSPRQDNSRPLLSPSGDGSTLTDDDSVAFARAHPRCALLQC